MSAPKFPSLHLPAWPRTLWLPCWVWSFFLLYNWRLHFPFFSSSKILLLFLGGSILLLGLGHMILRLTTKVHSAGIFMSLALLVLLFYTPFHKLFDSSFEGWRHRYSLLLLGASIIITGVYLVRTSSPPVKFFRYLFVLGMVLTSVEGVGLLWKMFHYPIDIQSAIPTEKELVESDTYPPSSLPDIYHLVLDAHTSFQSLEQYWNHRPDSLIHFLEQRGFFQAQHALTSYSNTLPSMAALLNMAYLPEEMALSTDERWREGIGRKAIENNQLLECLENAGYEVHNLSPFDLKEHPRYYDLPFLINPNDTYIPLIKMTVLNFWQQRKSRQLHKDNFAILDSLVVAAGERTHVPRYFFAHLCMPHSPYLFNHQGNFLAQRDPTVPHEKAYLDHLVYTDKVVMQVMDQLMQAMKENSVIVIHGDHGFRYLGNPQGFVDEKYSTLLSLYFPQGRYNALSDSTHLVNLFRIVLNENVGYQVPLLPYRTPETIKENHK